MVLARVAEYFAPSATNPDAPRVRPDYTYTDRKVENERDRSAPFMENEDDDEEEARPAYAHAMLAGGLGGLCGDMLMHSLDTVKTRQQGDPHRPPKYRHLIPSYFKIWRQEGFTSGLYGGVTPAAVGSFIGTTIFFLSYEWTKRAMVDHGVPPSVAYLGAGLAADLAASPLYVPTEVVKTRLQLQGQYNNQCFKSGYNYRSTMDAARTIVRTEGIPALFHGYKATLYRDLPFSALQFTFYEKEREYAKKWVGSKNIGLPLEILTGMTAGGLAGTITCPLDVVKTRIQTQITTNNSASHAETTFATIPSSSSRSTRPSPATGQAATFQKRGISTSSPSTHITYAGAATLDTSSVIRGLRFVYHTEGFVGCFRGVGPRAVWTSVQSGTMLVLYQALLRYFEDHPFAGEEAT